MANGSVPFRPNFPKEWPGAYRGRGAAIAPRVDPAAAGRPARGCQGQLGLRRKTGSPRPYMKRKELIRHLEAHGCPLKREGGSHSIYFVGSVPANSHFLISRRFSWLAWTSFVAPVLGFQHLLECGSWKGSLHLRITGWLPVARPVRARCHWVALTGFQGGFRAWRGPCNSGIRERSIR